MKTAIIGPGAMGCLFAAYLKNGGLDVTLIDCSETAAKQIRANGIQVQGVRGQLQVPVTITTDAASLGPVDLVLVWVKAYHTESAMRQHLALVGRDTAVLSIQNGMGNTEALARVVAATQVIGGSTTMGANSLGVGQVHHAGEGDTFIGELDGGLSPRVQDIAQRLSAAGIKVECQTNISGLIWKKLLVNVGINALTAILGVKNGVLAEIEPARRLLAAAVKEGIDAARGQGHVFDEAALIALVEDVARRTAQNRSSMLQDIESGSKTEIDYINGAIARLGDYPVNQTLCDLTHVIETSAGEKHEN